MDISLPNAEVLGEVYHFLFETTAGVATLVGVIFAISIVASVVMEVRHKKRYAHIPQDPDDDYDEE